MAAALGRAVRRLLRKYRTLSSLLGQGSEDEAGGASSPQARPWQQQGRGPVGEEERYATQRQPPPYEAAAPLGERNYVAEARSKAASVAGAYQPTVPAIVGGLALLCQGLCPMPGIAEGLKGVICTTAQPKVRGGPHSRPHTLVYPAACSPDPLLQRSWTGC